VYADVEPERGDVVLFKSYGSWVAHRAIDYWQFEKAEPSGYSEVKGWQTKGDARSRPDQYLRGNGSRMYRQSLAGRQNTAGVVVGAISLLDLGRVTGACMVAVAWFRTVERVDVGGRPDVAGVVDEDGQI
jgi:hypothetical protein